MKLFRSSKVFFFRLPPWEHSGLECYIRVLSASAWNVKPSPFCF
jgi:hypothetical protein